MAYCVEGLGNRLGASRRRLQDLDSTLDLFAHRLSRALVVTEDAHCEVQLCKVPGLLAQDWQEYD